MTTSALLAMRRKRRWPSGVDRRTRSEELQRDLRWLRTAVGVPLRPLDPNVGSALEDGEARPSVAVLALGPVPHQRCAARELWVPRRDLPFEFRRKARARP